MRKFFLKSCVVILSQINRMMRETGNPSGCHKNNSQMETLLKCARSLIYPNYLKKLSTSFVVILLLTSNSYAVDFDAADDSIPLGQIGTFWDGDYTVSCWMNPASDGNLLCVSADDAPNTARHMQLKKKLDGSFQMLAGLITAGNECIVNSGAKATGVWYSVVGTYDKSTKTCELFVNGVSAGTDTSVNQAVNDPRVTIGKLNPDGDINAFDGEIGEVAIWTTILTDAEILSIFDSKKKRHACQLQPSSLLDYLPFDECAEGASCDGVTFNSICGSGGNNGTGDNGTNNTGLTGVAGTVLTYP